MSTRDSIDDSWEKLRLRIANTNPEINESGMLMIEAVFYDGAVIGATVASNTSTAAVLAAFEKKETGT